MSIWRIRGGMPLNGSLSAQGAKNSVLPIMAAAVLAGCEVELLRCPDLSDVSTTIDILKTLGCIVERDADIVNIDSRTMTGCTVPNEMMREMRSSVIFLGAILSRCGEAILSQPGGCELGPRPIDLHLEALGALGADIEDRGGNLHCRAGKLRGTHINFKFPSVGATENAMLAACSAEGETVITNAAREPEIVDLQNFLLALGAQVSGAGTSTITISGFNPKERVGYRVMPDRIVASTMLCAAAAAGGNLELRDILPEHFGSVTRSLSEMGCEISVKRNTVRLKSEGVLTAAEPIITRPYPGFPTDAAPTLMASCLKATGTTVFVENIFENRYRHVEELKLMGADILTEQRVAMVTGVRELHGAHVTATDLRGGAALDCSRAFRRRGDGRTRHRAH